MTTKNGKIYYSSNAAQEWTLLPLTLDENAVLNAIVLTPRNPMVMYVGVAEDSIIPNATTRVGGVYKLRTGEKPGLFWRRLRNGQFSRSWFIPKIPEMLVAGTLGGSLKVWILDHLAKDLSTKPS